VVSTLKVSTVKDNKTHENSNITAEVAMQQWRIKAQKCHEGGFPLLESQEYFSEQITFKLACVCE
jgi:hypothetical protein